MAQQNKTFNVINQPPVANFNFSGNPNPQVNQPVGHLPTFPNNNRMSFPQQSQLLNPQQEQFDPEQNAAKLNECLNQRKKREEQRYKFYIDKGYKPSGYA